MPTKWAIKVENSNPPEYLWLDPNQAGFDIYITNKLTEAALFNTEDDATNLVVRIGEVRPGVYFEFISITTLEPDLVNIKH